MSRVIQTVETVITAAATPPMTTDYARSHIRALTATEDTLITAWVLAADQYFREQTSRPTITETREVWLDAFPACNGRIEIPNPPLQDVISVTYIDSDGHAQVFSDGASPETRYFTVTAPEGPYAQRGWIVPADGYSWPTARCQADAVRVRYTCGYGPAATDMPALVKAILCFLVGHFDQFRSAVHEQERGTIAEVPFGVKMMLDGFKYSALPTIRMSAEAWADDWTRR
jgi:uncharacterized phiE125 gp8 family phage protein